LTDEKRISQIIKKFSFNEDYVSIRSSLEKNYDVDIDGQVLAEYRSAGVILPSILCDVIKQECGDRLNLIRATITDIRQSGNQWLCLSGDQQIAENEILVIANGTGLNELGLAPHFPVENIRGQVAVFNENVNSKNIIKVMNADKHITPSINNKHYLGATYSRESTSLEVDVNESWELLDAINKTVPGMLKQSDYCDAWVGFRAMSKDRVPIVGAVPDEKFYTKEYADIHHGDAKKTYQPACYLGGLFVSAAHGSRGFTSSFFSAELIAAQIEGTPVPVSKTVMDYLSPSRFIVDDLKHR
jgi:tRNA 5-methylaminomethyl-2-thiouridine biosynthesis bifunctional protein